MVLREIRDSDDETGNGNVVHLEYLGQHSQPGECLKVGYFVHIFNTINFKNKILFCNSQQQFFSSSPAIQVFTRMDSRTTSPTMLDQSDAVNSNAPQLYSDDETLDTIDRKVSAMFNGNIFGDTRTSDNGNFSSETEDGIRKRRCPEMKEERESTEDAANDSISEGEGGVYNLQLRRKRLVWFMHLS